MLFRSKTSWWKKVLNVAATAAPIVAAPFTGGTSLALIGAGSGALKGALSGGAKGALTGAAMGAATSAVGGGAAGAAAKRGAVPLGVDFSKSMVAHAQLLHPGLDFREGDAEELPVGNGLFEAVVMNFGILHLALARLPTQLEHVLVHLTKARRTDRLAVGQASTIGVDRQTAADLGLAELDHVLLGTVLAQPSLGHVHHLGATLGVLDLGEIGRAHV